jgi:hypothetical protein
MSEADKKQVGGNHYKVGDVIEHWNYAASHNFDYFQGQITKYVTRWKKKNGLQDLEKAQHFLEKYIELEKTKLLAAQMEVEEAIFSDSEPGRGYVNQD